jgi:hypothetical protein
MFMLHALQYSFPLFYNLCCNLQTAGKFNFVSLKFLNPFRSPNFSIRPAFYASDGLNVARYFHCSQTRLLKINYLFLVNSGIHDKQETRIRGGKQVVPPRT